MLAFLKRLFGFVARPAAPATTRSPRAAGPARVRQPDRPRLDPRAVDSIAGALPSPATLPNLDQPALNGDLLAMLDGREHFNATLSAKEEQVLAAVSHRVDEGQLELPHLPQTTLSAMEMTSKNSSSVADVAELIAHDAVITSELLRVANSALYATHHPCTTLRDAVVRLGMRATRSMIMSVSMRTMLLRDKGLAAIATEVWRQSQSAAQIARAIAPRLGFEPDRAFLIGLLHDIGKIALLETVRREVRDRFEIRPCLIGRVFFLQHERAGERIASAWKLPDELVSVAGCHHHYEKNAEHSRAAALARLVHTLDLVLSIGGLGEATRLESLPEFDALGIDPDDRPEILELVCETYLAGRAAGAPTA
ncbi:MAG: HDOD domain-containing protein [Planctomycetes bacterium]|nr:HDOD domain-containing protein [Planctomycetota bacterium]